uniref:Uncharacterized protein n=1 Tax=Arundo donax TaxID=35708 RepID=A0A0A8ZYW3_ARUDO
MQGISLYIQRSYLGHYDSVEQFTPFKLEAIKS